MKVLVVGSGGREHALAWKMAQSPQVSQVYVAPGNAGTRNQDGVSNVALAAHEIEKLLSFARERNVKFTVVGPEAPLAMGIVDTFQAHKSAIIGPARRAARLESSKVFSKQFMGRWGIPTARCEFFDEAETAIAYLESCDFPVVVKADGLAAGKGVVVAASRDEAVRAIRGMLSGADFGDAGRKIVIEEFLDGEEISFICLIAGGHILPFASSQDHKAVGDGDTGMNTGGMGAYSPAPIVDAGLSKKIIREIIAPAVQGMEAEGSPYTGFLYAGLMVDAQGRLKVLEFNCRLGDPETQPILMRLRTDLAGIFELALEGGMEDVKMEWDQRPGLGVVMAAGGYPGSYEKGRVVSGLDRVNDDCVKVFHAGTLEDKGKVITSGGRVLCVTALADTISAAQNRAYEGCRKISWEGAFYRSDIGYRAVAREKGAL